MSEGNYKDFSHDVESASRRVIIFTGCIGYKIFSMAAVPYTMNYM